jgi:hypothetical protein
MNTVCWTCGTLSEKSEDDELSVQIIRIVETLKPKSVQRLIELVRVAQPSRSEQEIMDRIMRLQAQGRLRFAPAQTRMDETLTAYLTSRMARWYWVTILLAAATAAVALAVPENAVPLVYLRYVLGAIFILWLPGYALIRALFPQKLPLSGSFESSEKSLDLIERAALSLGVSIALVPIVGFLLNYTPWGITLTPIILSLVALTVVFSTAAVIRENEARKAKN